MDATRLNLLLLKAVLPDCDIGRDTIFTIIEEDDPLRMLAMFYIAQTWRFGMAVSSHSVGVHGLAD